MRKTRKSGEARRRELLAAEVAWATPPAGGEGDLTAAVCYPHTYRVGMASLGYQLVWGTFASHPAFRAERFFSNYEGKAPRGVAREGRGLERGTPLSEADVIAFSLYYEPDYLRFYGMLAGGGVRPWSAERGEYDPYVICGGPAVTANPEPVAPFADAIVLGDAEEALPAALEVIAGEWGSARGKIHGLLAGVPGVYVPSLYRALYGAPGVAPAIVPEGEVPARVKAARVADLTPYRGGSWLASPHAEFGKLLLLEPVRGCGRGCSFCQTGAVSSPPRGRDISSLWPLIEETAGRVRKVGLVGAALADYGEAAALAGGIFERGFLLSVGSLALAAPATPAIVKALGASGQRGVTFAPEAATEDMRARVGKALPPGRLEECVEAAAAAGLSKIKLYYIVGVPGETAADVAAIGEELTRLKRRFRKLVFEARVNPLVPKRGTPLAEVPLISACGFRERLRAIQAEARGVKVVGGSWREARLQADLGRGDRAVSRWIASAAEKRGQGAER